MGRGLSKLQQTILVSAYENRESEARGENKPTGADCYYAEVLVKHFEWEPALNPLRYTWGENAGKRRPGGHNFSKAQIGKRKYNAAMAGLSRAVSRLAARGLVEPRCGAIAKWSGVNLTAAGADMAKRLLVKLPDQFPKY